MEYLCPPGYERAEAQGPCEVITGAAGLLLYTTYLVPSCRRVAMVCSVECTSEHWEYAVSGCDSGSESRHVTYSWTLPKVCNNGQLPPDAEVDCGTCPLLCTCGISVVVSYQRLFSLFMFGVQMRYRLTPPPASWSSPCVSLVV